MNKSKFLKKSLAMLLALMLVFAMIPLSASAAQTDYINYLYVNGQNAAVDGDGYSVTVGTEKVTLTANLKDNVRLLYVDDQGDEKAVNVSGGTYIDLADGYSVGDDEYQLTVIAMAKETPDSDTETPHKYTVNIKVAEAPADDNTALQGLKAGDQTWPYMVDWSVDNVAHAVNVLFKFGAHEPAINGDGTIVPKLLDTDFIAVSEEATVKVLNDETGKPYLTVTAGTDSTTKYAINFTHEPAFESFEIPGQVGETEFTYGSGDSNYIDIDVPYGYDHTKVIPAFELVDELADNDLVENTNANLVFTSGVTTIPVSADGVVCKKPMTTISGDGWQYEFALETAKEYNGGDGWTNVILRIHAVQKNPAGDLLTVKVTQNGAAKGSNTIEIKDVGSTDVEMPANTNLKDNTKTYTAVLTYSTSATVELTDATRNNAVVANTVGTSTVTIDDIALKEGNSFSINVKSEDGVTTKTYNINLHAAATAEAKLTSVTFKDTGNNNKLYEASISHDADDKGTVTLKVPYSWRDINNADDVLVYIKASTGTTVTLQNTAENTWQESYNGVYSLKELSDGGAEDWFPYAGSATATTQIVVTNEADGKTVTRTYTVKIETETAKGDRTIESLNFSSEDNVKDITADNTFSAELGTAKLDDKTTNGQTVKTIKVTVPYSWTGTTAYLYNLTMSDGAKLYSQNGSWPTATEEHAVSATGALTFDLTTTGKFDAVTDGEIDTTKAIPVRVLSEANAVNATETNNNEITDALTTGSKLYTEYWIYFVKAPAETGCELLSIESVDENVTATLEGQTITINVPATYPTTDYIYTSSENLFALKFETSKLATVYQSYTQTSNTFANKIVSEKTTFAVYDDGTDKELWLIGNDGKGNGNNYQITGEISAGVDAPNKIWVRAEDEVNAKAYDVKLVVNKVETGADVTALSVNGTAATIARDQINVRLPLGTKLYPVTLDIDASKMATVYVSPTSVADPTSGTTYLYDPEARYDVNRPLKITVVAEDKETSKIYTLTATVADSFNDVPTSEWYYDEVMTAANAGWINGTKPGYFEPNGTMTRGDFAVIIARILGCDTEATVESKFPDCNETDYFNAAVTFCKLRGIIDGDDKGYFNPYDAITREEMAKILCNALELDELETSANPFDDDAEIAQWAKGYVNAVQAEGIMEGSNGSFNPRDNATRAEGAAVLVRAFA